MERTRALSLSTDIALETIVAAFIRGWFYWVIVAYYNKCLVWTSSKPPDLLVRIYLTYRRNPRELAEKKFLLSDQHTHGDKCHAFDLGDGCFMELADENHKKGLNENAS